MKYGSTGDRFRVILVFNRPITDLTQFKQNMKFLTSKYQSDPACIDGARFFFRCHSIVSVATKGKTITPLHFQPKAYTAPKRHLVVAHSHQLPEWIKKKLRDNIPPGQRNNQCFALAAALSERGFQLPEIQDLLRNSVMFSPDFTNEEFNKATSNGFFAAKGSNS